MPNYRQTVPEGLYLPTSGSLGKLTQEPKKLIEFRLSDEVIDAIIEGRVGRIASGIISAPFSGCDLVVSRYEEGVDITARMSVGPEFTTSITNDRKPSETEINELLSRRILGASIIGNGVTFEPPSGNIVSSESKRWPLIWAISSSGAFEDELIGCVRYGKPIEKSESGIRIVLNDITLVMTVLMHGLAEKFGMNPSRTVIQT